jgi:hypothetical protein
VERQEPHHVGASDRVPTQEVRLAVAVEVCNGRQLPVHIRQRRQGTAVPPPSSRSHTRRHSRASPDCATPGPIRRRRSCRIGTARHAARSAHGDPSRLMSLAGASSCRVALAAQFCAGTSGPSHPSYGAHDIAQRRRGGPWGEAQRQSEAPRQSTATEQCVMPIVLGAVDGWWTGGRTPRDTQGHAGPQIPKRRAR